MIEKMKNDDKQYYSCLYHCYGVRLELYLPDASWQPDIALLQTHVPGIDIDTGIESTIEHDSADNMNNFNSHGDIHSHTQTLDKSLSSVFWKLAHPDMTLQIIVDCHEEENQRSHASSLTIQQHSEFQKTVHLAIQLPSKFPDNSLHEDKKTIWKNDLPHFIYALLRQYWIEAGLSPVHSLCVGGGHRLNNLKSLVIGHSGTGKSTVATELLKLDYPVHSLDRTLVHINNIDNDINKNFNFNKKHVHLTQFAGTQVLSLRKNSININGNKHDDMNNDTNINININTLLQSLNHSDSSQIYRVVAENDERIIIQMQSENHNNGNHVHANNINRIYLLNINDGEFKVSPLSPLSALHTLYPYFMDKIKEDIILGGGEIVFSGKISEKIAESVQNQLIQKLKNLVESIPVATLWGSAEQCAQYLAFDSK